MTAMECKILSTFDSKGTPVTLDVIRKGFEEIHTAMHTVRKKCVPVVWEDIIRISPDGIFLNDTPRPLSKDQALLMMLDKIRIGFDEEETR